MLVLPSERLANCTQFHPVLGRYSDELEAAAETRAVLQLSLIILLDGATGQFEEEIYECAARQFTRQRDAHSALRDYLRTPVDDLVSSRRDDDDLDPYVERVAFPAAVLTRFYV